MKRRKQFVAAGSALIIVGVLSGCGVAQTSASGTPVSATKKHTLNTNSNQVQNSATPIGTGVASVVPAFVAWNGYAYEERGYINHVGAKIGVATNLRSATVYSVPGKNPNQMIAVEVESPSPKFISAVRDQLDTKTAQIPSDWMTFDTQEVGKTVQPGEKITITGSVFFRALYGKAIQVTVRRYGYGKNATLQYFKVSDTGAFKGTIDIPKQLPGQPGKTRYNLSFWVPDKTSTVDLVLTLK